MLSKCHIGSHSTFHVIDKCGIKLQNKKIIHIGAHDFLEYDIFEFFEISRADLFECNKYVYPQLLERIKGNHKYHPHFACLHEKDGETKIFYTYRNIKDGASGLYLPERMFDYIKDCPLTGENWEVKTVTYDTYAHDTFLPNDYYFMILDVQGSELSVLKGAQTLLNQPSLTWLYIEVSHVPVYKNGPLEGDITKYLSQYGFELFAYREDWNLGENLHGDNIYVRRT